MVVFPEAEALSDSEMQRLAAEFNLSEVAFVLPDSKHTARVRIFNKMAEMQFAGHPNVGTALVLACESGSSSQTMCFEEGAGVINAYIEREGLTVQHNAEREALLCK